MNETLLKRYNTITAAVEQDSAKRTHSKAKIEILKGELQSFGIPNKEDANKMITKLENEIKTETEEFNKRLTSFERKYASRLQKIG